VNYLSRPENLHLFPYSANAINLFRKSGFLVILITNQSGIGRGIFDEKTLVKVHLKLENDLLAENSKLDAIYFCPHIAADNCECRKPKSGMIEQASRDFAIDIEYSWMIGDKAADIEAGINAGTKTALVLTGYGKNEVEKVSQKPDFIGKDLYAIAELIVELP
jgi:D-glycero-D-manno-heptose 1,7-bisphosphate phosphatase